MRNGDGSFYRTNEIVRERSDCPDWLEQFAEDMAVKEQVQKSEPINGTKKTASAKTAVEVAREREVNNQPSIYEMMSSIISNKKPKYSSVEEAVKDYQRRTGLSSYLERTSSDRIKDLAKSVVEASCDIEDDSNDVEWDDKKKSLVSESDKSDVAEVPAIISENPEIENYVENVIDTNPGIQMPALLNSLVETFSRQGITQNLFSDRDFLNWLNSIMIRKNNIINNEAAPSHIGKGVGTQVDYSGQTDSNKDPFTLLVPNKGSF